MEEYDIDSLLGEMDFNSGKLQDIGNGLFLTNREVQVLDQYKINYHNCHSLKEVLFEIEEVLNDMDIVDEELDMVSSSISERDYYQNTNK
jgi:hypothetical protein